MNSVKEIDKLIEQFKRQYPESITYGETRDNCGVTCADFISYAQYFGLRVSRVKGYFRVDNLQLTRKDFLPEELVKIDKAGLKTPMELYDFAQQEGLIQILKYIPHYWCSYEGQIIDFVAQGQFVNTGLAYDVSESRYFLQIPVN